MPSIHRALLLAVALVSLGGVAQAQVPPGQYQMAQQPQDGWWHRLWADYHRNHVWPDPFVAQDRQAVNSMFMLMESNGWRKQCLLCDYHFIDGGDVLNQSGEMHLQWILSQTPTQRRTVYVQRGPKAAVTANRMDSVQQVVARMVPSGPLPPVVEVNLPAQGYSGEDVDTVYSNSRKTSPDPRLPGATRASVN
ncbi:MAG TPA: hypothetical protein VG433_15990 [Pirellulales bacterium]|nr:hypothetical protein [Pirellulales bacterium]